MLLRRTGGLCVAISQPAHARLSGLLAEFWGNDRFAAPSADERFAAGLHDIGWLDWERDPQFDPQTRLPRIFQDVPAAEHTRMWEEGVERAATIGLTTAILVSLHAQTIYRRTFDAAKAAPEAAHLVESFLKRQSAWREEAADRARRDPGQAPAVDRARLGFGQRLIAAVDFLSLLLCWGRTSGEILRDAPTTVEGRTDMSLEERDGAIGLDPWPFGPDEIRLPVHGRRIEAGGYDDASALRRALEEAPWITIDFRLRRGLRQRDPGR